MFWLALLTRDTGIPASRRLQIKDEVVALDFDLAVSYRLFRLRLEEHKAMAQEIAYEVSKIFGSVEEKGPRQKPRASSKMTKSKDAI